MSSGEPGTRSVTLTPADLDALELLLAGLLGEPRYVLPGSPGDGPATPHLRVPDPPAGLALAGTVQLLDLEQTPVAALELTGTSSDAAGTWLAGEVTALREFEHGALRARRLTTRPPEGAFRQVVAFREPPTSAVLEELGTAAADRPLLLLAVVDVADRPVREVAGLVADLDALAEQWRSSRGDVRVNLLAVPTVLAEQEGAVDAVIGALGVRDATVAPRSGRALRRSPGRPGAVVMFTGLSGSGKSTIARALHDRLVATDPREVTLLDGDEVRRMISAELGFSPADRDANVRRIGWIAALVARHGGIALCAPIAPYASTRAEVRRMAEASGTFVLVHVATPLEVCEARDRKGLYARARAGEIGEFTGVSAPYEEPLDADLVLDTTTTTVDDCVDAVLARLDDTAGSAPAGVASTRIDPDHSRST